MQSKKVLTWCVQEKGTGKIAGRLDLGGFQKKTFAEIAYHFAQDFWHRGVTTEVVECITNFGIQKLKLHRIQGLVRTENIASILVLKKNGYIEEGRLRLYAFGKEFHNAVILAIVNKDNLKNNTL